MIQESCFVLSSGENFQVQLISNKTRVIFKYLVFFYLSCFSSLDTQNLVFKSHIYIYQNWGVRSSYVMKTDRNGKIQGP